MIDLHTHILPGIDDGAGSLEEALRMTQELYKQEVRMAVCTPHYDATKSSLQDFVERRSNAIALMKDSKITLISGSETTLNDYLFHYPELSQLCIGNTRYLLVELPFSKKWEENVYGLLEKLLGYYNLIPVIAHIERYPAAKIATVRRLNGMGCLLQVNTASLLDKKSWYRAAVYMRHGLIDVLSSDCHNMSTRPPIITDAYEKVRLKLGSSYCNRYRNNAEDMIHGRELRGKSVYILQ